MYNNVRKQSRKPVIQYMKKVEIMKSINDNEQPCVNIERTDEIILHYLKRNFLFTAIINYEDDICYPVSVDDRLPVSDDIENGITIKRLIEDSTNIVHPLFFQRFKEFLSPEVTGKAYEEKQLLTQELLLKNKGDNKYQWHMLRLTPIHNEENKRVFFYTCLLTDTIMKRREYEKDECFNMSVLKQLIHDQILIYIINLENEMSKLVHSRENDEFDRYANKFKDHREMMIHLCDNYIAEDFKKDFARYSDYEYIEKQFASGRDRIVYVFRDVSGRAFELNISKYNDYSETYKFVVFSIRELS